MRKVYTIIRNNTWGGKEYTRESKLYTTKGGTKQALRYSSNVTLTVQEYELVPLRKVAKDVFLVEKKEQVCYTLSAHDCSPESYGNTTLEKALAHYSTMHNVPVQSIRVDQFTVLQV